MSEEAESQIVFLFNSDGVHRIPWTYSRIDFHARLPTNSAWALIDSNEKNLVPPNFILHPIRDTTVNIVVAAAPRSDRWEKWTK
jgi:hypothetical protein